MSKHAHAHAHADAPCSKILQPERVMDKTTTAEQKQTQDPGRADVVLPDDNTCGSVVGSQGEWL